MASASSDKLDEQQRVIGYSITSLASSVEGIFFAAVTVVIAGAIGRDSRHCSTSLEYAGAEVRRGLPHARRGRAALQREPPLRVAGGTNGVGPTYVARATEATG